MDSSNAEEKECPRCLHIKKLEEFVNSRKVIGKYCTECLEKKRKYRSEINAKNMVKTSQIVQDVVSNEKPEKEKFLSQ
jgi:hypothetical protein